MSGTYMNTDGRSDGLNAGAAHDSGLYDPDRHDNQIVAVYDTHAHAATARDALTAAGVAASAIQVVDGAENPAETTRADDHDEGFWGAIKSLFVPDDDKTAYHHAVDRGHAMLIVRPDASMDRSQVIHVLESTNPIDFDAKLEEWRQAGYDYSTQPAARSTGQADATTSPVSPMTGSAAVDTGYRTDTDTTGTTRPAAPMTGAASMPKTESAMPGVDVTGTGLGAAAHDDVRMAAPRTDTADNPDTIKIVEENLRVGKREVAQGAVRVRSYVVERPVEEQVRLHDERVSIDRRPVDRPATPADVGAFQERTIEARATAEEPVVEKTARVVEEIGIHKEASDRTETVHDTVRKTEVEIDDTTGQKSGGSLSTGGTVTNATPGATSSGMNTPRK